MWPLGDPMNYYTRLAIVIVIVIGLSQFMPEAVNTFLVLLIVSMLIMQSGTFAKLLASLKL